MGQDHRAEDDAQVIDQPTDGGPEEIIVALQEGGEDRRDDHKYHLGNQQAGECDGEMIGI